MVGWNWSKNIEYRASEVARPSTVAELSELVAAASKAKGLGTRHSFNRVADTSGLQIDTSQLDLSVSVDHERMTATVPGGWSYGAVAAALEAEGVALANMGSLPHISLAGGTATGTHGSGDTNQVLAAEVSGLELVTADGSVRRIDRSSPELAAVAIGLGAFGVIAEMTLDVEPSYLIRQDLYVMTTWDMVLENLDQIMASAYSVNLHCHYGTPDFRTIWQKSRVEVDAFGQPIEVDVPDMVWGARRWDTVEIEGDRLNPATIPGPWSERLAHFTPHGEPSARGDELQAEYFVDRGDAVVALDALRKIGHEIDPHLRGSEIRSVKGDELWLSPCVGRDCLSIGLTFKKHPAEVHALLPKIETALAPFEPTPHWGKLFACDRDALVDRFDRLDDFLALAAEFDPAGLFANDYLDRLSPRPRS